MVAGAFHRCRARGIVATSRPCLIHNSFQDCPPLRPASLAFRGHWRSCPDCPTNFRPAGRACFARCACCPDCQWLCSPPFLARFRCALRIIREISSTTEDAMAKVTRNVGRHAGDSRRESAPGQALGFLRETPLPSLLSLSCLAALSPAVSRKYHGRLQSHRAGATILPREASRSAPRLGS